LAVRSSRARLRSQYRPVVDSIRANAVASPSVYSSSSENAMFHELRYTVRALKNDPSFAAIAVLFPRVTGPEVVDVRSGYYGGEMGVQMGEHAEFAGTYLVTPNFFPVFGVAPTFGRAFETNDAQRAAIVSLP